MKEEVKLRRPSIVAALLWAFGMFIMGFTVYSLIFWEGGLTTVDLHVSLLIFVAFSSGINAIATGALIDMHTMRYRTRKKVHEQNSRGVISVVLPMFPILGLWKIVSKVRNTS